MIIKVVPLPCHEGVKFDMILPDHFVVTLEIDIYEMRLLGPESMAQVIELKVLQWAREHDYDTEGLCIIFC